MFSINVKILKYVPLILIYITVNIPLKIRSINFSSFKNIDNLPKKEVRTRAKYQFTLPQVYNLNLRRN